MPKIYKCTGSVIRKSASALKTGCLGVFPTETVYGLGADATNKHAVARIYEVKKRPYSHPLIVHISSSSFLEIWARKIPDYALKLATDFWPGPMTLILQRSSLAKDFVTGGQNSIALRVPSHHIAQKLLNDFNEFEGLGIAAPSANMFGKVSPTNATHVLNDLSHNLNSQDIILNSGSSQVGIESTIIDCTKFLPYVLRPGFITKEMIESSLSIKLKDFTGNTKVRTSGVFPSHYAPIARVFLSGMPKKGDGFIALKSIKTPLGAYRLASPKNEIEFAKVLYKSLRLGDDKKLPNIYIVPPSNNGIGRAVNDRLSKIANIAKVI